MRLKTTLVLMVLVAALGAFILMYERMQPGPDEREQQARRALRVNPELVTYLRIERTNLVVSCRLEDGRWRMETPMEAYADKGAVDRILAGLQEMPKGDVITADERARHGTRLADYGLADPVARIQFREDNRDRTLWIGDAAVVGDGLYVAESVPGDISVIVTSTNLWGFLPAESDAIRSRRLLPGAPPKLKRLEVKRASGFLQLVLDEHGQWRIHQPLVGRASGAFVRDFAAKFLGAQAEGFEADQVLDLAPYGLDEPAAQVSMWPQAGADPHVLSLGDPVEDMPDLVYATTGLGRSVYTVPRRLLVEANLDAEVLRDRQLLGLNEAAIGYVAIRSGEEEIELRKDDAGSWSLTKPVLRDAEDDIVWGFLTQWKDVRIQRFVADASTNLAWLAAAPSLGQVQIAERPPEASVSPPAAAAPATRMPTAILIKAYADPDGSSQILVTMSHEPGVYAIHAGAVSAWSVDPLDYYARDALHLNPADVRRITLQRGDLTQAVERGEDGAFAPYPAGSGRLVPGAVDQVLATVEPLTVSRYLVADAEGLRRWGLQEPSATLTFGLTGDAGIAKTVMFGAATGEDDGIYAMIRGQGTVFVLPAEAHRRLLGDLLIRPTTPDA